MILIKPIGGLCNCLRVLFSYYKYARSINSELYVVWRVTKECPGHFLKYFEPIPNIHFIDKKKPHERFFYKGCQINKNFKPDYKKLKLKPYLQKIILNRVNEIDKNYVAVHVRRTDHRVYSNHDEKFINFLNNSNNKNKNIYIATDNILTYNKYKIIYKNRIKLNFHKIIKNGFRKTSLQDAIIDIYMCVYSNNFLGSRWSSFSELIYTLRELK